MACTGHSALGLDIPKQYAFAPPRWIFFHMHPLKYLLDEVKRAGAETWNVKKRKGRGKERYRPWCVSELSSSRGRPFGQLSSSRG